MGSVDTRFLIIIVQSIMAIIFGYLGFLVIKRDKKRLNLIFSAFYFFIVIGTVFNWTYAYLLPGDLYYVILYLNYFTNFFYFASIGFILIFILMVLKSEKIIDTKKQLLYLIINLGVLGGVMMILISIPVSNVYPGDIWGVYFKDAANSSPYWTLPFFLAVILIITGLSVAPTLYYLIQTLKQFTDPDLKRKFKYFSFGYVESCMFAYIIIINNYLKIFAPGFTIIALALAIILVSTGAYLMYIGVGKQISK
ncbi:MAG: hypothetical protein ACFFBP_15190 [Promethearchaeota archaeon]